MTTFVHNDLDISAANVVASGQPLIQQLSEAARLLQLQIAQTFLQLAPNSAQQFLLTLVLVSTSLTMWFAQFGQKQMAGIKQN